MNHLAVYKRLIQRAVERNMATGERHHVVPRSVFDNPYASQILGFTASTANAAENVVRLTFREHFVCHLLLPHILKGNQDCYLKTLHALNLMSNRGGSRMYGVLKQAYSQALSESMKGQPSRAKGAKWSEESKAARSATHYMTGKSYEEVYGGTLAADLRKQRAEVMRNREVTVETRAKLKGREFTPEWRARLSLAASKPKSEEARRARYKDTSVYTFVSPEGVEVDATIADMVLIYGLSGDVHKLIRGTLKRTHGWTLKEGM